MATTDLSPLSWNDFGTSFPPSRSSTPAGPVCRARLPRGFSRIIGVPTDVRFGGTVPVNKGRTYAQKQGLRYEQRVHDVLSAIYDERYRPSPAILYSDRTGLRRAIPDGLLDLGDRYVVVEVKYSHCEKAWWQLNRLYLPLLVRLLNKPILMCEVVYSFDPDVRWPTPAVETKSLHRLFPGVTGVLQWKF